MLDEKVIRCLGPSSQFKLFPWPWAGYDVVSWARICERLWSLGIDSASLCSLAGRYDNTIPTRFLAPIDCSKIPALVGMWEGLCNCNDGTVRLHYSVISAYAVNFVKLRDRWLAIVIVNDIPNNICSLAKRSSFRCWISYIFNYCSFWLSAYCSGHENFC